MVSNPNAQSQLRSEPGARLYVILRAAIFIDAVVFLTAALFNEGVKVPLGLAVLGFPAPVSQAGIGEAVIGLALLAAAVTGSITVSWVALWLSVAGIIFGLSSPAVQGPARDVHILLVPLALIVFGLLMWQRQESPRLNHGLGTSGAVASPGGPRTQWQPISVAICGLMVVATVAFAVASIIHFGVTLTLGPVRINDPFGGAAIPEAVIAAVLAMGSATLIARWAMAWPSALGATLFAFLLTIYGLTVTLRSSRTGDIAYHISILVVLAVIVGLLLLPAARRNLSG
ncbi:MAG: hypothetical protein M1132_13930 [Chloroflexi bacterium]|nr:hypothetical protein [Chloroflexota bacterium]